MSWEPQTPIYLECTTWEYKACFPKKYAKCMHMKLSEGNMSAIAPI